MAKRFNFDEAITTDIKGAASDSYIDNIKMIKMTDIETNSENFYSLPDIEELAEDIERQGLIHSLAVTKTSYGTYKLISGHRRLSAIKLLSEKGKWNNGTVPCFVITAKKSEAEMNLDLIMLNHTQRKYSDADIFKEHEELKKIFTQLEADGVEIKGRLREKIAKAMHVSSAQIGKIENIKNNAIDSVKVAVENGELSISTANEIAKHNATKQQEIISSPIEKIKTADVRNTNKADTDVKKKELFQKVRKGEVRVLLGSTQKMGAGTNVQDRLIALHDVDCPWRPSDLEQRAGRIIRQGNSNPEVEIYRYVTEQTFDAYLYQLVEGKQKFASQIMTSKSPVRSADDIDETALSYAEIKMLATGNPYIKEKMDLDIQIQKLKLLKANYLSEKYNLEDKIIKFYPQKIASLANTIKALEQDLSTAKAHPKPVDDSFVGMEINGEYISEKADAGKAILESCKQMNSSDPIKIGKYRGFDMELQLNLTTHFYEVLLKSATTQKVSLGDDPNGNITRIDNAIGRIPDHIENAKAELKNIQTQFETAQIEVQKPFAQEEELKAKTKRQIEVEKLISSGENEPEQNAISDYYYFSATDEQINALNNASIPFEKQTKADGSMVIRVATDDKSKAEAIMNSKNLIL